MPRPRSLPLFLRLRGARVEAGPVGQRQRLGLHRFELAAVVGLPHRVGVGHLLRADHVAPADLGRVQAQAARGRVHQPFDDVDRLGSAGAAVGAQRRGVGQHRLQLEVDGLDVVDAGRHPRADQQLDDHAGGRGIGADVGFGVHAQAEHAAVGVERQFGMAADVAAVAGGQEFLAALGHPLHRSAAACACRRRRRCPPGRHRSSCRSRRRRRRPPRAACRWASRRPRCTACRARRWASACSCAASRGRRRTLPSTVRGSSEVGARRWFSRSSATTCAAWAKAAVAGLGIAVAHLGGEVVGRVGPDLGRAGGEGVVQVHRRSAVPRSRPAPRRGRRARHRRWRRPPPPPLRRRSAPRPTASAWRGVCGALAPPGPGNTGCELIGLTPAFTRSAPV